MRRNKWITKKILCLCVALAMLITLFGGQYMVVQAEDMEIAVVDVTITIPLVGQDDIKVSYSVPDGAGYTVTVRDANWKDGSATNDADYFYNGDIYYTLFDVQATSGYTLTENTIVRVNKDVSGVKMVGGIEIPASTFEYTTYPTALGVVDSIDFGNLPSGDIGKTADEYSLNGTNYTVSGWWNIYDRSLEYWVPIDSTHTFASGNVYQFEVEAYPNAGYEFAEDLTAKADGKKADCSYSAVWAGYKKTVSHAQEISSVTYDLTSAMDVKVGDTYDGTKVSVTVPEGSNYTVYGYWIDEDGNTPSIFEKGKDYSFNYTVAANEGYCFVEDLKANNEFVYNDGVSFGSSEDKSFKTIIDEAVVAGIVEPKIGQDIPKGSTGDVIELTVPDGSGYTAKGMWRNSDNSVATGKFEEGKAYHLIVIAAADEDSRFSDDALITINGVTYSPDTIEGGNNGKAIMYRVKYSFRDKIKKIEITGFKEPVIGEAAKVDSIKVEDNANYKIDAKAWYDYYTWDEVTSFEEGNAYVLETCIMSDDGYEFSKDAVVLLDGEDITDMCYIYDTDLYIDIPYWFKEVVPEVRLDNIQKPAVGDMPSNDVKLPQGAKYTIDEAVWKIWDDEHKSYESFTGAFKTGESYLLSVRIRIDDEDYMFDSTDTKIYTNGDLCEDASIYPDFIDYSLPFSPEMKTIDKIELTIQSPVVGQSATIDPIVTVPEGANYGVGSEANQPPHWIEGNVNSIKYISGIFEEDGNYGVVFHVFAGAGYVFAEELQIIVNDTRLNKENVSTGDKVSMGRYFFNEECAHSYSDWKDAGDGTHARECTICGAKDSVKHTYKDNKCVDCGNVMQVDEPVEEKPDETTSNGDVAGNNNPNNDSSPATGDNALVIPVAMLMVMCVAIFLRLKKNES
ncbi:MAG: hypothetical protein IKL53_05920 [Lachnospiraceae bacterium]|nr:hypothetical protein [Lachnospiraceae bacterium]